jgi:hypothetical protein
VSAGLFFAIVPAWRASRLDVLSLIRGASLRGRRTRHALGRPMIAVQVAIAIVLVVSSLAAARALISVLNEPVGFDDENVLLVTVGPRSSEGTQVDAVRFYEQVVSRLSQRGDVTSAGAGYPTPVDIVMRRERSTTTTDNLWWVQVLPGYFETLGMRLREGRVPRRDDAAMDLEPAVLSASAARTLFPGRSPVGEILRSGVRPMRVIGVIDDEISGTEMVGRPVYFVPRELPTILRVVVKTRNRSAQTLTGIRRDVVAMAAPTEPVTARWMRDSIGTLNTYRDPRFQAVVLGSFAVLALGLATLGIFAIVAAAVVERTREMGVRIAIGAPPRALVRMIVWNASVPIGVGLVAGSAASQLFGRLAGSYISGLTINAPVALGIGMMTVAIAGLVAAYFPARRASRIDPIVVLRAE